MIALSEDGTSKNQIKKQLVTSNSKIFERNNIRKNGVVYTPELLASYFAQKTLKYFFNDPDFKKNKMISIVDPACGNGVLLGSIAEIIENQNLSQINLCGVDIDKKAIESSKKRLDAFKDQINSVLINTNSLCPFEKMKLLAGWARIYKSADVQQGFDVLIANPPWGANLTDYKENLDQSEFSTLKGQFDSYELFIELALKIVKKGGYFAFLVPDSILNHGKKIIRDILLESSEIKFISRLGEKIFPKINRACAIIIVKNSPPSNQNNVDCFRLSSKDRSMILSGTKTFSDAETKALHVVPQQRFVNNPYKQFDIDLKENETFVLKKLRNSSMTFSDFLTSTRGVELSSSGLVSICDKCGQGAPFSKKSSFKCRNCGNIYNPKEAPTKKIVNDCNKPNSKPLIRGRDLKRYETNTVQWIELEQKGIDFKSPTTYDSPKILVRKTGVGITAAIDYNSSYTTQVVYILKNKKKSNPSLEFFLALLNSRTYYFFLSKSFGELEWKSHPYLTQSQILSLPIPDFSSPSKKEIVNEISSLLKPLLRNSKPNDEIDLKIELLIGKLFDLSGDEYKIIFNALDESDDLLPILDLKNIMLEDLLNQLRKT